MIFIIKKKIFKKIKEFRLSYFYIWFYEESKFVIYIYLSYKMKVRIYFNFFFRVRMIYKEFIVIKFFVLWMFFLVKWFNEFDYIYFEKLFLKIKKIKIFSYYKKVDFRVSYNYRKIYFFNDY